MELEQQLSTTKVELAVKSAELLVTHFAMQTTNFQHNQEDSSSKRRQTVNSDSSKDEIEQYRYTQPTKEY